eukprot:scaffold4011_cov115-Alexandrium_tamarense.AAC.2
MAVDLLPLTFHEWQGHVNHQVIERKSLPKTHPLSRTPANYSKRSNSNNIITEFKYLVSRTNIPPN